MLMAPDPTEDTPMLTPPNLTESTPVLMTLYPTDGMAFLTVLDSTEGMAFLTTPDPTAGPVEVGRLSALGSAKERHLNRRMASHYVLAVVGPLTKDESCPGLSAPGSAEEAQGGDLNSCSTANYYVLAAASPLAKDESRPSHSTQCSNRLLASSGLASSGEAGPAAAPTNLQSLTAPGSAAHSPCLLCSSTTHPVGANASVTQLSHPRLHPLHRCVLHVSLVLKI